VIWLLVLVLFMLLLAGLTWAGLRRERRHERADLERTAEERERARTARMERRRRLGLPDQDDEMQP
jgi:hypothetical protein